MHGDTAKVLITTDERTIVGALLCTILFAVGIAIRSTTRQRKHEVVVRRMRVLDSISGVVYNPEEIYEMLVAFSVPISRAWIRAPSTLRSSTLLSRKRRQLGRHGKLRATKQAQLSYPCKHKTAPVGAVLNIFGSCIIAFSFAGLGCILWHTVHGQTNP